MRIRSIYCACNERSDNPLDHYETTNCGAAAPGRPERIPLEWIRSVLAAESGDTFHADGRLTATRILGCPRETAILDNKDVPFDVRRFNSIHWGTVLHAELARHAKEGDYKEVAIPPFPFGGYELQGTFDHVRADFRLLKDWKTHGENKQGWSYKDFIKGKPNREGAAQLNLYRIGIAKSVLKVEPDSYRPTLLLVHAANVAHDGVPWYEQECPIMSEEQILALRPHDDDEHPLTQPYTVAELMQQLAEFDRKRRLLTPADGNYNEAVSRLIAEMPMVGAGVWAWKWNSRARRKEKLAIGDKCTKYCAARDICMGLERAAGRMW